MAGALARAACGRRPCEIVKGLSLLSLLGCSLFSFSSFALSSTGCCFSCELGAPPSLHRADMTVLFSFFFLAPVPLFSTFEAGPPLLFAPPTSVNHAYLDGRTPVLSRPSRPRWTHQSGSCAAGRIPRSTCSGLNRCPLQLDGGRCREARDWQPEKGSTESVHRYRHAHEGPSTGNTHRLAHLFVRCDH